MRHSGNPKGNDMTKHLSELFAVAPETRKASRKPARKANPVTVTTADGKVSTRKPSKAQFLADSFRAWATAVGNYDEATLRLISILVNDDSVSARKASEIATEALGNARGWSKDKITALRWTGVVWALAIADLSDRPTDDDDAPVTVDALIAEVRTLCSVLGKGRVEEALATVDEPSVVAYVTALRDATTGTNSDPAEVSEDDEVAEGEPEETKAGKTDADRIRAILNTLSGLEYDETLADALPALVDAVAEIIVKHTPAEATV